MYNVFREKIIALADISFRMQIQWRLSNDSLLIQDEIDLMLLYVVLSLQFLWGTAERSGGIRGTVQRRSVDQFAVYHFVSRAYIHSKWRRNPLFADEYQVYVSFVV